MLRQFRILLFVAVAVLPLLPASAAYAGEAGKLVFVTGQVQVAGRAAQQDAAVQEGDELTTGADGYVYVKTIDSGFLILRPNSKARITAYHIDEKNPNNTHVKLELLNGVARSISGQGVKQARQNFRFNTPVAAIGVRGTDFIVFTNQQTSRVEVVSGGVVVSGFAGACGPEGGGPCEGSASRELFAGQAGMLLQVTRGEHAPQLLRSPTLAPDQNTPPRNDEPVGKTGPSTGSAPASTSNSTPTTAVITIATPLQQLELNLEAQKGAVLNSGKPTSSQVQPDGNAVKPPAEVVVPPEQPVVAPPVVVVPPVEPPVVAPPVVVVPPVVEPPVITPPVVTPPVVTPPVVPSEPEVIWGRWKAVAGLPVDAEFQAKKAAGAYSNSSFLGNYQITRLKSTALVMPTEGSASFVLNGSEANMQVQGQAAVQASVKDASLAIDFGARTFKTAMTVYTASDSILMSGEGSVSKTGVMSHGAGSGSYISGFVGGADAGEAGYVFKTINNPRITAEGATSWKR